jgi:hypothetical protein
MTWGRSFCFFGGGGGKKPVSGLRYVRSWTSIPNFSTKIFEKRKEREVDKFFL